LVADGVKPTVGILVCQEFSPNLTQAADAANAREDPAGNKYNIELKRVDELLP
jgi:hypothetical protein